MELSGSGLSGERVPFRKETGELAFGGSNPPGSTIYDTRDVDEGRAVRYETLGVPPSQSPNNDKEDSPYHESITAVGITEVSRRDTNMVPKV